MAVSLIITSFYAAKKKQTVIVIPPQVTKEFWMEQDRVSPDLIEQTAVFLATMMGNLSPVNAEYNVSTLIRHYLFNRDRQDIREDLLSQAAYVKKNNITQSFFPSKVTVEENAMQASVEGVSTVTIGAVKASTEKITYRMRFRAKNYRLWVEELYMDKSQAKKDRNKHREE